MKYRSRISVLLTVIIMVILFLIEAIGSKDSVSVLLSLSIMFIVLVLVFGSINYTISGKRLIIRTLGFKMATIDIVMIKLLRRSYSPLSSPAASLKRLEIKFYYKGRVETALISPVREPEFIEKLKEINPNIKIMVDDKQGVARFLDWDI